MTPRRVAVVGATGAVGREMLAVLAQREVPLRSLALFASPRSAGRSLPFAGEQHRVVDVAQADWNAYDIVLLAAGSALSRELAPRARRAGAVVIDNSSAFRRHEDVPLVVPEVNPDALRAHDGLIANPNCSTILLVLALWPLQRAAGVRRVVVSTYQAASGAGERAMTVLREGARAHLDGCPAPAADPLPHPLAFNLFPQIDSFEADGYTREEDKMCFETRRILGLPALPVEATCVRVPVERCHSEAVGVELQRPLSVAEARSLWSAAEGVVVQDEPARSLVPQPIERAGRDEVAVGRVRLSRVFDPGLAFWLAGDQLRKGAALNAVQIAEMV